MKLNYLSERIIISIFDDQSGKKVEAALAAARKAAEILKNSRRIVATEIMQLANLDLKPENHELGKGTKPDLLKLIRQKLNFIEFDKDIEIFEELNKHLLLSKRRILSNHRKSS